MAIKIGILWAFFTAATLCEIHLAEVCFVQCFGGGGEHAKVLGSDPPRVPVDPPLEVEFTE